MHVQEGEDPFDLAAIPSVASHARRVEASELLVTVAAAHFHHPNLANAVDVP